MASERQRLANRRNGSKGGPSTEAGKQRSRLNTLKHGRCERMVDLGKRDNDKMILVCCELFPRVGVETVVKPALEPRF